MNQGFTLLPMLNYDLSSVNQAPAVPPRSTKLPFRLSHSNPGNSCKSSVTKRVSFHKAFCVDRALTTTTPILERLRLLEAVTDALEASLSSLDLMADDDNGATRTAQAAALQVQAVMAKTPRSSPTRRRYARRNSFVIHRRHGANLFAVSNSKSDSRISVEQADSTSPSKGPLGLSKYESQLVFESMKDRLMSSA